MTTLKEAVSGQAGFSSFVELQQANLDLLEQTEDKTGSSLEKTKNFIGRAVSTGAILQRSSERKAAQAAIDYWTTTLILSREVSSIANKTAGGSLDVPTLVPFDASRRPDIQAASPYKGLDPFTQEDADNFFGREDAAAELQKRLESDLPIVLLIGPSGSGKSSLIHAGLLPRLERSETLAGYKCLPVVYPGQAPLAAILKKTQRQMKNA